MKEDAFDAWWNAALEAAEDYNAVDVSKLRAKFS